MPRGQLGPRNLPAVGDITFPTDADFHIRYGHMTGDPNFVFKVAPGFPLNEAKGLQSGNGLVLALLAETGVVQVTLHNEMMLTDIGDAVAARALARSNSRTALFIGTRPQARRQIEAHAALLPDLLFLVWDRDLAKIEGPIVDVAPTAYVAAVHDLEHTVGCVDVVKAATSSKSPVVMSDYVRSGAHITAVGADAPGKQELDAALVARADVLIVNIVAQSVDHGELLHAARRDLIKAENLNQLGAVLSNAGRKRDSDDQITITDLTGIAAQDIAIANTVLAAWNATLG